ncbi:MAG: hypothetical protein ACTTIZ_03700 [Treponema sp.]
MEASDKEKLKKNGFVFLIFLLLIAVLFSLIFFTFFKDNTFKDIAIDMLTTSPLCEEYRNIHSIETIKKHTSLTFPSVLEAKWEEGQAYIFFVRLTGKYGVQTAFFLYDERKQETTFCGLVGQDFKKSASYYGINDGIIHYWCGKITKYIQNNR